MRPDNADAMQAPKGYQRWPLVWFQCPSCSHRAGSAIALLRLPPPQDTAFRFWCERCGRFSVLRNPRWWFGLQALIACGLSYLILEGVLYALPQQPDLAVFVAFPVFLGVWAGLNRLGNLYRVDADPTTSTKETVGR